MCAAISILRGRNMLPVMAFQLYCLQSCKIERLVLEFSENIPYRYNFLRKLNFM